MSRMDNNRMKLSVAVLLLPVVLFGQLRETEPNDSFEQANSISLNDSVLIASAFEPVGDVDYFVMQLNQNCMYYLTSIENSENVSPNIALYREGNPINILTSNVGGRNGNGNFRLSGYVPDSTGRYFAKIFNVNWTQGDYKLRFAGGRCHEEMLIHEPDNSIISVVDLDYLAESDTIYGAIYPENDIDYYKISGTAGYQFIIGTKPIYDLDVRDTDTYMTLQDVWGTVIAENDDIGTVSTSSGSVNCTFSRVSGTFPRSGDYYISVRSFYNTNFGQTISETHPPMGEYGLYFLTSDPPPPEIVTRYPHVELPTIGSILVQWNTSVPLQTHLLWGETEACENTILHEEQVQEHLVKIAELASGSKYFYQVVLEDDTTDCEFFYTAKPSTTKNVKFFVIGDTSPYAGFGSTPAQLQVANQIMKVEYDFGLHAGDVNQHHGEEYDLVFYQPYKDILKNNPIFPCIGNHDNYHDNAQTYLASFNLPHNNPDSTERYYSFNYGHAHFISLDTESPYNPGTPQYEWLVQDLRSEMRNETMWTFVYFHKPPWSEGWEGYPGEMNVRQHLVPLFEQYGVDMTFSGHTHNYERGILNGVCYIITGGGGAPLESGVQAYDHEHVTVRVNQHHFTYIRLQDNILELQAINKEGQIIDELTIEKPVSAIGQSILNESDMPEQFRFYRAYPNPFNNATRIRFDLKERVRLTLTICDINGRVVRSIFSGETNPGTHQLEWNGKNNAGETVSSGIYFIRFETPDFVQIQRAVFLK
ncbi:T9SS type A sorting domain-containing protein [candidate division KSB1 bacterium]|nr:T9SS type A sorting domain-containing protein [candidate division KSB1 bacterium]